MPVVRSTESRRTETPNGVMTTLASPSQGDSQLAVWRVDMVPGAAGPQHVFDTDQVWAVVGGKARIDLAGDTVAVAAGDTVIMPADAQRKITAHPDAGFTAIVCAPARTRIYRSGPDAAKPEAATLDGDKILPKWIA
jgi:quercetin dioxygenase-like cupin family protein